MSEDEKTILKFDSGAGGFEYMIIILVVLAVFMLLAGGYFLWTWQPPGT
ncbi:MAG: hypothetical protein AAB229_05140 [Candidatus Hydrogenedentota bacterium]